MRLGKKAETAHAARKAANIRKEKMKYKDGLGKQRRLQYLGLA